ncbi:MAG TPA: DoxX family protein [Pirellulales bacterium]|jgi:uncharacterized membrane protein YphA (DoxX/SURF4 family)|nr:DoxX family protein [Pirellulales bacterium]
MKCSKFQFGLVSVVALVALRLCIGWHFFKEGLSHYTDAKWSSEGFLKQAKGPFADWLQAPLPDFHGWSHLIPIADLPNASDDGSSTLEVKVDARKPKAEKAKVWKKWLDAVDHDWLRIENQIGAFYGFTDQQKKAAEALHVAARQQLEESLSGFEPDIVAYRHDARRLADLENSPGAKEIPNIKTRIANAQRDLTSEPALGIDHKPGEWLDEAKGVETAFIRSLENLADQEQAKKGYPPVEKTPLEKQDRFVTYSLIAIGACLILGFLTPLASLGGAAFLLTIVMAQPFWINDTVPTYNQYVEIFALLFLAASCAGRFAGLDFFISRLFRGCCRSAKGN